MVGGLSTGRLCKFLTVDRCCLAVVGLVATQTTITQITYVTVTKITVVANVAIAVTNTVCVFLVVVERGWRGGRKEG